MKLKKLLVLGFLILPFNSVSASVIHCSAPSSVYVGDTISVTFSGSLDSASATWKGTVSSTGNASYIGGDLSFWKDGASFSNTVSFRANSAGTASFTVQDIDVSDENQEYGGSDTCTVEIIQPTAPSQSSSSSSSYIPEREYSSDNTLKSLKIENEKLSPEFNNEVLEYNAIVSGKTEKVNIIAEKNDDTAEISGNGEKELKEGLNRFELVVTAENGNSRTFIINVTRKEINPIEVTVNKKKYTVIKKDIQLEVPKGFLEDKIKINDQDVVSYYNESTGYHLVALVTDEGENGWYIYDKKKSTYTKYNEFKTDGVRLILFEPTDVDIPKGYNTNEFTLNNKKVSGYATDPSSKFRLVYALNMDTGNKDFYLYDIEEKTFQRFNYVKEDLSLTKKLEILLIVLAGIIVLFFVIIISPMVVNKKMKKMLKTRPIINKDNKQDIKKVDNKEMKLSNTREINLENTKTQKLDLDKTSTKKLDLEKTSTKKIDLEKTKTKELELNKTSKQKVLLDDTKTEVLSKKELKQKLKEEKRKAKEERKEFLDL